MQPPCSSSSSLLRFFTQLMCLQLIAQDAELRALKKTLAQHQARTTEQNGFVAALLEDRQVIVQRCTTAEQQVRTLMLHWCTTAHA